MSGAGSTHDPHEAAEAAQAGPSGVAAMGGGGGGPAGGAPAPDQLPAANIIQLPDELLGRIMQLAVKQHWR